MSTTLTETSKTIGAELEFHFEDGVTQQDYDKLVKKVQRHRDNSEYTTSVLFFADSKIVRVILVYTVHDRSINKAYDKLRSPLVRLIDSHKQAAFYSWSL